MHGIVLAKFFIIYAGGLAMRTLSSYLWSCAFKTTWRQSWSSIKDIRKSLDFLYVGIAWMFFLFFFQNLFKLSIWNLNMNVTIFCSGKVTTQHFDSLKGFHKVGKAANLHVWQWRPQSGGWDNTCKSAWWEWACDDTTDRGLITPIWL